MATRQQLRAHIKGLIQNHFTTVFDYQPGQLYEDDLPCASVAFESGSSARGFDDYVDTSARLVIDITARTNGAIDTELDLLGSKVEQAIRADPKLGGLAVAIERNGFQYDRDPESLDACLSLSFTVLYNDED